MKKFVSILLISLIVIQTSGFTFEDVLKVKDLCQHAKFHQEEYGDNFFEFLSEHYGDKVDTHENQHKEHENLPLKHIDNSFHSQITFTNSHLVYNFSNVSEDIKKVTHFYKNSYSFQSKASVFQPPKQA